MNFINIAFAEEMPALIKLTAGVDSIYRYSISIGGILAFGIIIFAGIEYIISAGNVARQSDAKSRIFSAILGLIILLGAVLIARGIPGLLTFSEANLITPTPSTSSTGGDKVATPEDIQKSYTSGGVISNRLSPELEAKVRNVVNQKLDAAGTDPERLKQALNDVQNTYKDSIAARQSLEIFFGEVKKRGLDDELFFAHKSAIEKTTYINRMRDGRIAMTDILANSLSNVSYADLYNTAEFLRQNNPVRQSEFTNAFNGPKLGGVFIAFYTPNSGLDKLTPENRSDFVKSLNDKKIQDLYVNLPTTGRFRDNLKQILRNLERNIVFQL